jgi:polyisoprenoid-binding protein YceI
VSTPAVAIPGYVAGTWDIDPVHSDISIIARHFVVSKVRGHFKEFSGTIVTGDDALSSSVNATINAASIDTNNEQRDGHIRSADFLDVEKFPEITFASTGLQVNGDDFKLDGNLSLHGVTKPVTLDLELSGLGPDAYGGTRVGFSATATINRSDFGIDISMPLDGGGVVVGDKIQIALEVEGVLRAS